MADTPIAAVIDDTGISAPTLPDILSWLQSSFQQIYGTDIYIDPDSKDGQFLGILAAALNDCNATAIDVYNSFSPQTARGAALASRVKINGMSVQGPINSTVDVTAAGVPGTVILNGIVGDDNGVKWALPASVTIPAGGSITVTATCETTGAIAAAVGTVTKILTPIRGWASVTNPSAASVGSAGESDATVRQRQAVSSALPATTSIAALDAAVANVPGVAQYRWYENDDNVADADGLEPHSIALVVSGGTDADIGTAIALKKPPGTKTDGTTSYVHTDAVGLPTTIRFYRPTLNTIQVSIDITANTGYLSSIGDSLKKAVSDYISALAIGEDVDIFRVYVPAELDNAANGKTYTINSLQIGLNGGALGSASIPTAFNELAQASVADITLVVH